MMELIDRRKLLHTIEHSRDKPETYEGMIFDGGQYAEFILKCIKEAPTELTRMSDAKKSN